MSMIGRTLGNFELTSQIGKGGMGEVYQAKDHKLGRDVAIKVLPEEFARDSESVARFQREAKLLASLNHPNIAAIHGLEESDGTHFLVLELIEGETLAERIKSGAVPVEETLKLGLQIAEALEAAHEKGVIHRDLKPANIKVTPDGKVKVLDFGLAKAYAGDSENINLSNSPTLSDMATQQGVILGTAAYMPPEQAKGKSVDKRADIWAFGVVIFEMLKGRQVFTGETVSETLAAVIKSEPEWNSLPPNLHPRIRLMLERCLDKDPKKRYSGINDAWVDIDKVLADPGGVFVQPITAVKPKKKLVIGIPWIASIAILCLIIAGVAGWYLKPIPKPQVMRFEHDLAEGQEFSGADTSLLSISPDGSKFVYSTRKGLYLRSLDQLDARPISGTDGNSRQPLFSPDGKWICYYNVADSQLKKISVDGGASTTLCSASDPRHPSWDFEDGIIFAQEEGIMRISPIGGKPELIVKNEGVVIGEPQILPDRKTALFAFNENNKKMIAVHSLESGERKKFFEGNNPRYVKTGHIVYTLENNLLARPFDLADLEVTGGPIPIVEGVLHSGVHSQYAISRTGMIVYIPGGVVSAQSQLEWFDRDGNSKGTIGNPEPYMQFSLSFDEKRLVFEQITDLGISLWVMDLDRGGVPKKITSGKYEDRDPIWSPDGRYILFRSNRNDSDGLYRKLLAREEEPELLLKSEGRAVPEDWSDDGRFIMYGDIGSIYVLPLDDDQNPQDPIEVVPGLESTIYDEPKFSPDAEWIAYVSDESEQYDVYIKRWKVKSENQRISTQGGSQPQWREDGKGLFYLALDGNMMAVELRGETLDPDIPIRLFQTGLSVSTATDQYAVTRDGQKFLINNSLKTRDSSSIVIVTNWFEVLKKLAPVN